MSDLAPELHNNVVALTMPSGRVTMITREGILIPSKTTPTELPFPKSKTEVISIPIESDQAIIKLCDHEGPLSVISSYGFIHVKRDKGHNIDITGSGTFDQRCMCQLNHLAQACKGRLGVQHFVNEFFKQDYKEFFRYSTIHTTLIGEPCLGCKKTKTGRRW